MRRRLLRAGDPLDPVAVFEFVKREKAGRKVRMMCRLLGASASGHYAWVKRPQCPRAVEDARLRELIIAIHARSRGTYGVPRIRAELRFDHEVRCSGKRVRRLMLQLGIQGKRRRRRVRTTWRGLGAPAPDLVQRNFKATAPDQIYVADIKYVWTREGFLYLAGVIDVFTHAPVGWAMADTLHTDLVLEALKMALWRRRPAAGVIHHSDQGTQYTSLAFGRPLREAGLLGSMGRRGDAYDNALAESFWSTIDRELPADSVFIDRASARMAIFDYIECWFVPWRRHSSLGMLSPAEFERQWRTNRAVEEVMA